MENTSFVGTKYVHGKYKVLLAASKPKTKQFCLVVLLGQVVVTGGKGTLEDKAKHCVSLWESSLATGDVKAWGKTEGREFSPISPKTFLFVSVFLIEKIPV